MTQVNPIDEDTLDVKAEVYADELRMNGWSPQTIEAAFREHARSSRFMPSLAEVREQCRSCSQAIEYQRQRTQAALPMPDHIPDEQVKTNLEGLARVRDKLSKREKV